MAYFSAATLIVLVLILAAFIVPSTSFRGKRPVRLLLLGGAVAVGIAGFLLRPARATHDAKEGGQESDQGVMQDVERYIAANGDDLVGPAVSKGPRRKTRFTDSKENLMLAHSRKRRDMPPASLGVYIAKFP
jgi:hypothetical protein